MKERIVCVEWEDVCGSGSWDDCEKDYTGELIHCKTLGFILKSNRKSIVLAGTITDKERCCDRTVIPRSVVKSIKRL